MQRVEINSRTRSNFDAAANRVVSQTLALLKRLDD